jgi:eukaryotic-like serine/threonine-protein kinase
MGLPAGSRIGPYETVSLIGIGGMGEVYKARDTRLDRTVAVKLLQEEAADRPDRRARFETEARAISSLNHPNICTLFDIGHHQSRAFLVMEHLEGETLEDRLTSGPLPARELLRCATEIADALRHAHAAGLIHRDVKPSNVMVTRSGTKLLDFGLAKKPVLESAGGESTLSFDRRDLTAEGTMIGTFQYMAPEQLEGKPVDARTDIFAFGALLYEMATGRKAFAGKSQASLIASILTEQPPLISSARTAAPTDASLTALDHLVERCLAKNPEERWQTMHDVRVELEWMLHRQPPASVPVTTRAGIHIREGAAWTLAVVGLGVAVASSLFGFRHTAPSTTRFIVTAPPGATIGVAENRTRLAISPDGRQLAIVAFTQGTPQIWLRSLDSLAARPVPGTEGATSPFWSPDGRFLGFFSPNEGELRRVALHGGPVQTICSAQADGSPTWGPAGILFTEFPGGGIQLVSPEGGTPRPITRIDKDKRELNHYWPQFLPDGRHFIYMATGLDENGLRTTPSLYVASLDAADVRPIAQMHSRMTFVPPRHALFVQDGTLLAQDFDLQHAKLTGEPTKVVEGLAYFRTLGNGGFSVSSNGVLALQGNGEPFSLVWYDRRGNASPSAWPAQNFGSLRISPDATRVAVDVTDPLTGTADIWIYDVVRGVPIRFTADATTENQPVWSGDGQRILFRSELRGSPNLYGKAISTGSQVRLLADPSPLTPEDWSPDGRWIAYVRNTRQTSLDLWLLSLIDGAKPLLFSATRFDEWSARFSPDSRWVAFASTETGTPEVYVAPIGEPNNRRRVSLGGGSTPRWRGDGRELFYTSADNRSIMAVPIEPGPTFKAGLPERLFSMNAMPIARDRARNAVYDVSPDGQRFLVSLQAGEPTSSQITVVLNWTNLLAQ